jgi:hypothetical protein
VTGDRLHQQTPNLELFSVVRGTLSRKGDPARPFNRLFPATGLIGKMPTWAAQPLTPTPPGGSTAAFFANIGSDCPSGDAQTGSFSTLPRRRFGPQRPFHAAGAVSEWRVIRPEMTAGPPDHSFSAGGAAKRIINIYLSGRLF